jgi:pyruvate/2-oxoglutarate dehydrogenase complex dihydrolipoamide acyltransferase (E2) component
VSSSNTETLVDVTMPQMGVSVAEGTVVEWKKQPGDWVQADEIIASISTDKIDTDVEAPASGRVQELLVDVGTTVDVGTVLARIATDARPGEAHRSENDSSPAETSEAPAARETGPTRPRRYSPVVMRIASEHGIDLEQVEGTGRGGRVRKQDVLAFIEDGVPTHPAPEEAPMHIESPYRPDEPAPPKTRKPRFEAPAAEPAPSGAGSAPLSRMRQSIGAHMLHSLQTAATCTTVVEADLARIEAARRQTGFTYLPYIARATIDTLREFPPLNATLEGETLTTYDGVHLGIAVSLGEGGLIVPVIRDAQELSVEGLAKRIKELAVRARDNQLTPDEVHGGSFTITNPGGYGSIIATPVINQPQVAILDTEAVVKRPVVVTDELGNDSIAIRPMTYLCMSWDHRALDGAIAAQFLSALRKKLESWPTT